MLYYVPHQKFARRQREIQENSAPDRNHIVPPLRRNTRQNRLAVKIVMLVTTLIKMHQFIQTLVLGKSHIQTNRHTHVHEVTGISYDKQITRL